MERNWCETRERVSWQRGSWRCLTTDSQQSSGKCAHEGESASEFDDDNDDDDIGFVFVFVFVDCGVEMEWN